MKMTKKRIRKILDYQETIESMSNPFNKDIFFELMELHYWLKFLENEGTLTQHEMETAKHWEHSKDEKAKNRIVNEVYTIIEIMDTTQGAQPID